MATSTFYKDIYIDDKAADVLIKGLNSPKFPRPPKRDKKEIEHCEELIRQFHLRYETSGEKTNE